MRNKRSLQVSLVLLLRRVNQGLSRCCHDQVRDLRHVFITIFRLMVLPP